MSNQETMISLKSYAAVLAGLGAGLSLRRALALAEVPAPAWGPASEHWQAQIEESAASDLGLLVAFDGALSTARRRFEPTIEPITSDPQAWAQFRRHFVTAVSPVAFLAERDLSLGTYARLEADWANRLLADEALAATIQRHMDAALSECPALTLTLSPWLLDTDAAPPEAPALREAAPAIQQPIVAPTPAAPMPPPPLPSDNAVPVVRPTYPIDPPVTPAGAAWVSPAEHLATRHMEWDPTMTAPMPPLRAVGASAVLPFVEAAPPVGPAASPPGARTSAGPCVDVGQTVVASLVPVAAATPFRAANPEAMVKRVVSGALPRPLPELSVEQYAWVVAKLREAAPADFAGTLAALRLTPETREQLEAHWRGRMSRDPALQQAFIAALGRFMKGKGA